MGTQVTLTGTGVPHSAPGRAGPGALVRSGDIALQFDAGRGTVIRLAEAGVHPFSLSAQFVTHVHSDHVVDLADVAMTRWIEQQLHPTGPLVIVTPDGACAGFVNRMLDPFEVDIRLRMEHVQAEAPRIALQTFAPTASPQAVWVSDDESVRVLAVAVHHEPVEGAVAYRIETPDGAVVISGDTRVCTEVEELSRGADLLVHEACRTTAMADAIAGTVFERIFDYHADTVALGAMAKRASVPHVLLTHLIPAPGSAHDAELFAFDLEQGGFAGRVTVGEDLTTISLGAE